MKDTVQKLLVMPKGILAADESVKTITKRFTALSIDASEENIKAYRKMLFETPNLSDFISGVILFENDLEFVDYLIQKNIVPGVKVDKGLDPFENGEEQVTKGIEDLDERLKAFSALNLKFSKWRGVFSITDIYPSEKFMEQNLDNMAKFASISQKNNMVPVVEPEILLEGHQTTTRCDETMTVILNKLFEKLKNNGVELSSTILKMSMILPGRLSTVKAEPLEVAEATLRVIRKSVPKELGGIVFLSGGQTPDEAINNLNEIVKRKKEEDPWLISFSFARALQNDAMATWAGDSDNNSKSQEVFVKRLQMASLARMGQL